MDDIMLDKPEEYLRKALDEYSHAEYLSMAAGEQYPLARFDFARHIAELQTVITRQHQLAIRRKYLEAVLKLS